MKALETYGGVVLLAGFCCYLAAFGLICLAPTVLTEASVPFVIDVHGNRVEVPEYTAAEAAGREIYIQEMCWHCHSQFVRPVNDEDKRWGPVSQAGESAIDMPHMYGTRRTGPDLAREGGRRVDDWQFAHLYNPRSTVADSVMPGFTWYFEDYANAAEIRELVRDLDSDGDGIVSNFDDKSYWPEGADKRITSPLLDNGGVLAPRVIQSDQGTELRDGSYVDVYTEENRGDGILADYDARPRPTVDARNVVAYLQRLGIAIGPWRQPIHVTAPARPATPAMRGVEVEYTWTSPEGETKTVTLTVPDGVMPRRAREARRHGLAWDRATEEQRQTATMLQAQYDAVMAAWRRQNPAWDHRLREGQALFDRLCTSCHGAEGRGNGIAAEHLLIRPRDFTIGKYRYRSTQVGTKPLDGDIYRSIYRGLWGSSMPPWKHLPEEQIWLLVDYVKSFQETEGAGAAFPPVLTDGYIPEYDALEKALSIPAEPRVRPNRLEEHLARGRAVYLAMQCVSCHGSEGRADGPGWDKTLKDNGGRIRPRDFKPRAPGDQPELRFRGGAAPQDLYRTVFTGLDGTGMKSSYEDFRAGWGDAARVDELVARGAPEAEIAAARQAARRRLLVAVPDALPGVVSETDESGNPVQYLEQLEEGDDWALIHYVMWLSGIPIPTVK